MYYLLRLYTLACFSLFFYCSSQSQTYLPMLEDGKEWYVRYKCLNFCATNNSTTYRLFIDGDTTIGNLTYKRIVGNNYVDPSPFGWSNTGFFRWMREDTTTGKVYVLTDCQTNGIGPEQLLFDFSLNVGDKISNCVDTAITCTSVSTITTLDGIPRKQMSLDKFWTSNPEMIEGLGGNYYFWQLAPLAFWEAVYLDCVLKDGVPIYGPCANLITASPEAAEPSFSIRSFTHEEVQSFEVSQLPMEGTLTLFDLNGRKIKELPVAASGGRLEVSGLSKGIFIYQLKSGDQAINKKFIRL